MPNVPALVPVLLPWYQPALSLTWPAPFCPGVPVCLLACFCLLCLLWRIDLHFVCNQVLLCLPCVFRFAFHPRLGPALLPSQCLDLPPGDNDPCVLPLRFDPPSVPDLEPVFSPSDLLGSGSLLFRGYTSYPPRSFSSQCACSGRTEDGHQDSIVRVSRGPSLAFVCVSVWAWIKVSVTFAFNKLSVENCCWRCVVSESVRSGCDTKFKIITNIY